MSDQETQYSVGGEKSHKSIDNVASDRKTVLMTIAFEIDEDAAKGVGVTPQDVFDHITFAEDDVIDGFEISADVPYLSRVEHFFLKNGRVICKELLS